MDKLLFLCYTAYDTCGLGFDTRGVKTKQMTGKCADASLCVEAVKAAGSCTQMYKKQKEQAVR